IRMGVPVEGTDGRAGRVERLIFDTKRNKVVGVVVVQGGLLRHDVVVPIERVERADEEALRVRAAVEEISGMPPFSRAQYTEPPEDWLPPAGASASMYLFPASPYAVGAFAPPATQPAPPPEAEEALPPGTAELGPETEVFCLD